MCEITETFLLVWSTEGLIVFHVDLAKTFVSRDFSFLRKRCFVRYMSQ